MALGAFLLTRTADSAPVAVPSDAVAVIDPGSNKVVEAIPVGSSPGPIAVAEGYAWVVNTNDGTVSVINLDAREVTLNNGFDAGNSPSIAVRRDGRAVWLGTLDSTDVEPWYVPDAVVTPTLNIGDPTSAGVAALAFDGDSLLVADHGGALLRLEDGVSPDVPSRLELRLTPVALMAGLGFAWLANQGHTASRVDLETGRVTDVEVGDRPTAVAVGEESVWVTNGNDGTVSRISTTPLAVTATIDVGRDPTAITVGEGAVWVAKSLDGTISRIDPETNEVTETIEIGHRPLGIAVGNGLVWVTVRS